MLKEKIEHGKFTARYALFNVYHIHYVGVFLGFYDKGFFVQVDQKKAFDCAGLRDLADICEKCQVEIDNHKQYIQN